MRPEDGMPSTLWLCVIREAKLSVVIVRYVLYEKVSLVGLLEFGQLHQCHTYITTLCWRGIEQTALPFNGFLQPHELYTS
jgi:hypothetical protein